MTPRILAALAVLLVNGSAAASGQTPPGPGADLFQRHCVVCHSGAADSRAPSRAVLAMSAPEAIVRALTAGVMQPQGSKLTPDERRAIAEFLGGRPVRDDLSAPTAGRCAALPPFPDAAGTPQWNGWGVGVTNTRFQPSDQARLAAADVPKLKLKWAFGFPDATSAWSQPVVVAGRLFVGSQNGYVYSLDAKTGCTYWVFSAAAAVRSAITIGPGRSPAGAPTRAAYFGDMAGNVYAVDAGTGGLLWRRRVDEHQIARITGAPTLFQDRLYIPVSSLEEASGGNPKYECCTFRGSVVALDAADGRLRWKTFVLAEPKPLGKNADGVQSWGPSGAAIWGAPTIDAKRRMVYAATGNQYTGPESGTGDAVLAFNMDTGAIAWSKQLLPKDIFVGGCGPKSSAPRCPEQLGPDFDFGNSPILTTLSGGRDLIVIGQKSGIGWAIDPDRQGTVVWEYRAGKGALYGGMEWGSAVDDRHAYFPVADFPSPQPGGMHAVRLDTGERVWYTPAPAPLCGGGRGCDSAQLAAATVIPGVVFSGSNDGGLRAYDTASGKIVWEFNSNREFETANGVKASGASMNGAGPTVVDGMLYVNSGYRGGSGSFRAGNVLLAFGVE
jgi:polyvinyl alcohol dehydrogenase (cytochrome)